MITFSLLNGFLTSAKNIRIAKKHLLNKRYKNCLLTEKYIKKTNHELRIMTKRPGLIMSLAAYVAGDNN